MKKQRFKEFTFSNYLDRVFAGSFEFNSLIISAMNQFDAISIDHKIDAVAFTGISGASIGFPLAHLKEVSPICIRKEITSHASTKVEGPRKIVKNYIIVDDILETGGTIMGILNTMAEYGSVCRGILLSDVYSRNTTFTYKRRKIPLYKL